MQSLGLDVKVGGKSGSATANIIPEFAASAVM
jgi:hypothetical protein